MLGFWLWFWLYWLGAVFVLALKVVIKDLDNDTSWTFKDTLITFGYPVSVPVALFKIFTVKEK